MKRPFILVLSALVCLSAASASWAAVPEKPTSLRQEKLSPTQVRLRWDDNSDDEDGFEIFRLRQPQNDYVSRGTVGPNDNSFIDTVDPEEVYEYRVVAFNEDGDSDETNLCFVGRAAPAKPIDVYARLIALYVARISWVDRSNGESGFAIQRAKTGDTGFKTIAVVDANTESFDDDTLSPASTYTYRVRALGRPNRCIRNSGWSEERTITTKGGVRILTVDLFGVGRGTVRSLPVGMHCGPKEKTCFAEFPVETDVTLIADPNNGSEFRTWTGVDHCEFSDEPCTLNMGKDRIIGAIFKRDRN